MRHGESMGKLRKTQRVSDFPLSFHTTLLLVHGFLVPAVFWPANISLEYQQQIFRAGCLQRFWMVLGFHQLKASFSLAP